MLATVATLWCALAIDPGPGPAVLAVVLCLALSRSQLHRDARGRMEAALALPIVGLVATGVGVLLHRSAWLGAMLFVIGMFLSIWLRRFGPLASRAGSLIALPFIVLLTTPYLPRAQVGYVPPALLPAVIALMALLWVSLLHALARRVRFLPELRVTPASTLASRTSAGTSLRPIASTRMAIQMAAALMASFVVGYSLFGGRWTWIVLTTVIVLSGNRGRLDVAYKSLLRVLGAAAGTVIALSLGAAVGYHDANTITLVLSAVFLGVWLRPLGYGWWALFVTLALALLQGFEGSPAPDMLWPRLQEIALGAIIGVASAWFVLPVRSSAVLRRRIADALAALSNALECPESPHRPDEFVAALNQVEQLAPAFRASRRLTRPLRRLQPADWMDALAACREPAMSLIHSGLSAPVPLRQAVGAARKALREPAQILPALQHLRDTLAK